MSDQAPPEEATAAQDVASKLNQALDQTVFPIINAMARGITGCIMGIPPNRVLLAVCRNLGRVVGMSYGTGLLGPLMVERRQCIEAFQEGIRSIKIQPPPLQAQPGVTVPIHQDARH
jgi:hypothetical protein